MLGVLSVLDVPDALGAVRGQREGHAECAGCIGHWVRRAG